MLFTAGGIVNSSKLVEFLKAKAPIDVIDSGIMTSFKLITSQKAALFKTVSDAEMVTDSRALHLANAYSPKYVTASGILTEVNAEP